MREAVLTIQGLYNYDNTIFDYFEVPEGMSKELAINVIISRTSCFGLLYPDNVYMQYAIKVWSGSNNDIWTKMFATEKYEYNAIDNYDRYEEYEDNTEGANHQNGDANNFVAGYNTQALTNQSKQTQFADATHNNKITHKAHLHGNIGVTTTQAMIAEERDIVNFCTYDFIADSFKDTFCVRVY